MMPVLTFEELNIYVAASFVFGLMLGFVYDLFRIIRCFIATDRNGKKARRKGFLSKALFHSAQFFLDLIFCFLSTAATVVLFSSYGKGQARIISILALALGFILWNKTLGRFAYPLAKLLKKAVFTVLGFVYRHTVKHLLFFADKTFKTAWNKIIYKKLMEYDLIQRRNISVFVTGKEKVLNRKNELKDNKKKGKIGNEKHE